MNTEIRRQQLSLIIHYRTPKYDAMRTRIPFTIPSGLSPKDKLRAIRHATKDLPAVYGMMNKRAKVVSTEVSYEHAREVCYSEVLDSETPVFEQRKLTAEDVLKHGQESLWSIRDSGRIF